MRVKVFYDEDGNEVAVARNRSEFDAASNALYMTPGARFTVKDEERYFLQLDAKFSAQRTAA